ncbi:hypothetical protein EGA31_23020 [Mycobacterium avium subsp. paratuberculosis]|nr:hypothetical protein EGA31_23020 [Mycobacterium avium subsp. paratuberculosis]QPM73472.1 hypothetical protein MAPS_22655 [Mycobacterium avium subsp. paratuberculosis S397]
MIATGNPEIRAAKPAYASKSSPAITPSVNTSAARDSAARRSAGGSGAALRCAPSVRETYSGGTRLSRATATPAVLVTVSVLRVR